MKFGICCKPEQLQILKEAGYDYAEFNFTNIATCPSEEFDRIKKEVSRWGIPAEAYNGFFPTSIKLNENVDYDAVRAHARQGFARAKELGGKVAVLGSGGSRRIPEGYDRALAEEQFVNVLRICGEEAEKQDMTVAIEPLREKECNFINTVEEAIYFVKKADHPNVKALADFFHVSSSGEPLTAIETAGSLLAHVHLALPETRVYPTVEDEAVCAPWREALKTCGYNARISLEGKADPDFETAAREAIKILITFA